MEGRIVKALSGFYYVPMGDTLISCRGRGKLRQAEESPMVGDFVEFTITQGENGVIEKVLPRKNWFQRPTVANVDQIVIVASKAIPETDPYLIDRMISIAALKECEVLIVLTKSDLERATELQEIYQCAKIPTVLFSAETGEGVEELKHALHGKLSALSGNSGVGKSSLINAIDPRFSIEVKEVSEVLGRGKHTTRHLQLYSLSFGGEIIDTPGFSSFDTEELTLDLKNHLPETFVDFEPYLNQCRFDDCRHMEEKGCAVKKAVQDGNIHKVRYESYRRIFEECKPLKEWELKKK